MWDKLILPRSTLNRVFMLKHFGVEDAVKIWCVPIKGLYEDTYPCDLYPDCSRDISEPIENCDRFAYCSSDREECPDIAYSKSDTKLYRLDIMRITEHLSVEINNQFYIKDVRTEPERDFLCRVGFVNEFGTIKYEIFFGLFNEEGFVLPEICTYQLSINNPSIIFVPSVKSICVSSVHAIKNKKSMIIGLDDLTESDGISLCKSKLSDCISDFLSMQEKPKSAQSHLKHFPTPQEAPWKDIEMEYREEQTLNDNHTATSHMNEIIIAKCGDIEHKFTPNDFGMVNTRTSKGNRQWDILKAFLVNEGKFSKDNILERKRPAFEKQISNINIRLSEIFHQDTYPIYTLFEQNSFTCRFTVIKPE